MIDTCGCCEGTEVLTPAALANRPGLSALRYRIGTHGSFLETMKARLSSGDYPVLRSLTTRDSSDAGIALLDAWATVADVLTFYQERTANEGYLRTASERRSILELARLIGYRVRPGVSASVYLAFTIETGFDVDVPAGTRAQSIPGPGELPQPFETSTVLKARSTWNALKPRLTQPQFFTADSINYDTPIYLNGTATNVKVNTPLLVTFGTGSNPDRRLYRTLDVAVEQEAKRTRITLRPWLEGNVPPAPTPPSDNIAQNAIAIIDRYKDLKEFGLSTTRGIAARQVLPILIDLEGQLDPAAEDKQTLETLTAALDQLQPIFAALDVRTRRLRDWLSSLIGELTAQQQALKARLASQVKLHAAAGGEAGGETSGKFLSNQSIGFPIGSLLPALTKPPSVPPANTRRLSRDVTELYATRSDLIPQLVSTLNTGIGSKAYIAWGNVQVQPVPARSGMAVLNSIEALRVRASLFGHNVPPQPHYDPDTPGNRVLKDYVDPTPENTWNGLIQQLIEDEAPLQQVLLDAEYDQIQPGSWIAIERLDPGNESVQFFQVNKVQTVSLGVVGTAVKVTQLLLNTPWLTNAQLSDIQNSTPFLRMTNIYAQPELVPLIDMPIIDPIEGDTIELAELYDSLDSGRWLIVAGERADVLDANGQAIGGVLDAERVMLDRIIQDVQHVDDTTDLPGDRPHSFVKLASSLSYKYKPDTVTIYANVIDATHGETKSQTFGSGDGAQVYQQFALQNLPLTYVSAPTPAGADSTLVVRVNDVQWHEADNLAQLGPNDRKYLIRIDDDGKTSIIFGDGQHGARLPTGVENITGVYRRGIGAPGNVQARQISLLATKPLHVKSVINPSAASGGADAESRDQARRNAPLAVAALDRLVAVRDYADFARTFAGIGKADAVRLSDGRREVIHLTIAGANDIPIDQSSDLYRNLRLALRQYGEPYQPIVVVTRTLMLIVVSAKVRVLSDYDWDKVEPKIRAALLDTFSFERRELGQDVTYSEVVSTIQAVEGVAYVDVDVLDTVDEARLEQFLTTHADPNRPNQLATDLGLAFHPRLNPDLAHLDPNTGLIIPAQLAYLDAKMPDTLILTELRV